MGVSASVSITTTVLLLILAGLLGWVYVTNRQGVATGGGQPTWSTPQYLRYNVPVTS